MTRPWITLTCDPFVLVPSGKDEATLRDPTNVWLTLWDGRRVLLGTIPAGFRTDGVSRPGFIAWWLKRWGRELPAALIHDWLLWLFSRGVIGGPKFLIDLALPVALVSNGGSFLRATVMWLAVRTRPSRHTISDDLVEVAGDS